MRRHSCCRCCIIIDRQASCGMAGYITHKSHVQVMQCNCDQTGGGKETTQVAQVAGEASHMETLATMLIGVVLDITQRAFCRLGTSSVAVTEGLLKMCLRYQGTVYLAARVGMCLGTRLGVLAEDAAFW